VGGQQIYETILQGFMKYIPEGKKNKTGTSNKIDTFVRRMVCTEGHAKKIASLMVEMLVLDLRPAATVGFKQLINYLELDYYKVPSAMHMAKCLTDKYETAKSRLTVVLKDSQSMSTDIWTSIAAQAYITVTAHFILPDWVLKTFVLQTMSFPENHVAENIAEKVKGMLTNFCFWTVVELWQLFMIRAM